MTREETILAALAASNGASHEPVQVQKLFFLLDKKVSSQIDGPHFNFQPDDYGPFDVAVYRELERLQGKGLVEITSVSDTRSRLHRLTPIGQQKGNAILDGLDESLRAYLVRLSEWIRRQSFAQLVSAIYGAYPEMKVNSVFRGQR